MAFLLPRRPLPNSPLCATIWPLTGRGRVVPHLGWNLATRGLLGPNWGLGWFCGNWLWGGCFSVSVSEGTQGTHNSARGDWTGFASLDGNFFKGARRQCARVYSLAFAQYVGDLIFLNTRYASVLHTRLHSCTLHSFLSQFHSLARRTDST